MPPPVTQPFFVIAGPTASGKSELAVQVAERCGGEIVGADAFQIYDGLEILTAKPSANLRARVPHHLIGEIPLGAAFDVAQYAALAGSRIAEIHARGRMPIVCGGTGLYLRALLRGIAELPPANGELRASLAEHPLEELQERLIALDPDAATSVDLQNPRRVIRALEVCLLTGQPFSAFREEWKAPVGTSRGVTLVRDRTELHRRIEERTAAMFAAGVVDEVRSSPPAGPTADRAIGYREIRELLAGKIDQRECERAITEATRQYAKRQMTWFRSEPCLEPVELPPTSQLETLVETLATQAARST